MKTKTISLALIARAQGLLGGVDEFRFHPARQWRLDLAFPADRLGVEIQGGIWTAGKHSRGTGQERDFEKLAAAVLLGWRVFSLALGN